MRPNPYRRKPDAETPWQRTWRLSPERMREHVTRMVKMRAEKAEERASLIQALFDMMPDTPVRPYELRDTLAALWFETYGEELDAKAAWLQVRRAIRNGMVGKTDDGKYYPRKSFGLDGLTGG